MKNNRNEIEKQIQDGFILSSHIPTEQQIVQKSLEFQTDVAINQFVAGAMWMKSMLIKKAI